MLLAQDLRTRLYPLVEKVTQWLDQLGWVGAKRTTYLGHPFVYPRDSGIGIQIARGGEWDVLLGTLIPVLLPEEEPVICEVGSNIGGSLLQIKKSKPQAQILAFEPSDRFRPFLMRNLKLSGTTGVEVFPLLVSRRKGTIQLYNNTSTASVVSARYDDHPARRRQRATATTLDQIFQHRRHVDFIKVDTDGLDLEVLRGAEQTLLRDSPILYFELHPGLAHCPSEGLAWLCGIGYRDFICFTPLGKPLGTTTDPEQAIAWAKANLYCDILVCREGTSSLDRVAALLDSLA